MNHSTGNIYNDLMSFFRWIPILFYLNILWIVGTLGGLIFLGLGPATISLFETLKELLWKNNNISITQYFFNVYRREWKQINRWIVLLFAILIFLLIDYRLIVFFNTNILIARVVYPIFIILFSIIILSIIYLFVFYTNFELPFLKKVENSLLLVLSNPIRSLSIIFLLICYYNLILRWPLIFMFFFTSLPAFVIILILKKVYFKILWLSKN